MKYGSVAKMIALLDRDIILTHSRKRAKKFFRRLNDVALRRFFAALKYEMLNDKKCNEWNIMKKVCYRMKIGTSQYYSLRNRAIFFIENGSKSGKKPSR